MKKIIVLPLLFSYMYATEIKEIKFDGLVRISPQIASEMLKFSVGDEVDVKKINITIKEFFKQGYFDDIYVTEDKGVLTYYFKEKPAIAKVEIKGYLEGEQDKEKRDLILNIRKGDIYNLDKIKEAEKRIIEANEIDGYFDTVVEVESESLEGGAIELKFIVNRGEKITITKANYCSKTTLKEKDFTHNSANNEAQFMGWMWGRNDGVLKLRELEYDSARIKDYYMQKGYLDAEVSDPSLQVDFKTYNAELTYDIKEGEQYKVSEIQIELDKDVIELEKLKEDFRLSQNSIFNVENLRKDMNSMKDKIGDLGYAFVQIAPDLQKDEVNRKVVVKYRVIVGQKVYINDVIVSSNSRTLDRVIRREVFLAPKDLYSVTDLKDSKNALGRLGFFETVDIQEKRVSEDKMDLIIKVKETPTGSVMAGGGYGSYGGILLNASVSDRNIFGSGLDLSFGIDYSSKYLKYNTSLFNPRLFDSFYSGGLSLYKLDYESYYYTEEKTGASLSIGKNLNRYLKGSLSYGIVESTLSEFEGDIENSLYFIEGTTLKSSITPSLTFNNTDDYFVPRSGINASAYVEYAGIGGDLEFVKNYISGAIFYGLENIIDYDLILRYKIRGGTIIDNGYLPVNEKFYLGGISTVRGYESSSLSPKDELDRYIGGKNTVSNSIEASIPLIESAKMRLTFFYDYGMIGEDNFDEIVRSGAGSAIEWISPVGPIQFVFSKALNPEEGDRTTNFEFTLGSKF